MAKVQSQPSQLKMNEGAGLRLGIDVGRGNGLAACGMTFN
jgi:hypothetical protein